MKAGLIIVFFLTLYLLLGLTNYTQTGLPNGTNDFIFHWAIVSQDFKDPALLEVYGGVMEGFRQYPNAFHFLVRPISPNPLIFYFWAVIIIVLIAPALLYKIAGKFAVITYFALSLPHMALYSFTLPSFMILIYLLIYLNYRKNYLVFILLSLLATATHQFGIIVFALVAFAELFQKIIKKANLAPAGFLNIARADSPTDIANLFLNHLNFYFIWVARKSFDTFYTTIFLFGIAGAIFRDMRIIIISQVILSITCGLALKQHKPTKKYWLLWGFLILFNTLSFVWETERFIFM